MNLGFDLVDDPDGSRYAINDDAPTSASMREGARDTVRRAPSADEKKIKRRIQRQAASDVVEVDDVEEYKKEHPDADVATCGTCGRSWDDSISTSTTPVPSGRCPFEYEHDDEDEDDGSKEGALLAAMSDPRRTEPELRILAAELDRIRSGRRLARLTLAQVEEADGVIHDHLTPVLTHVRHTEATDWLGRVAYGPQDADDDDDAAILDDHENGFHDDEPHGGCPKCEGSSKSASLEHQVATEANMWFRRVASEVKADHEEFAEQAQGMAKRVAGSFGPRANQARREFLTQVSFLHRQASRTAATPSDVCPKCGAKTDPVVYGDTLKAECEECGWTGSKTKTAEIGPNHVKPWDIPEVKQEAIEEQEGQNGYGESSLEEEPVDMEPLNAEDWEDGESHAVPSTRAPNVTARRKTAVSLTNVGIDRDSGNGTGTDPSGKKVQFRLSEEDKKALSAVLYSDLAVNFSGVDVDQADIITTARRTASEGGSTCKQCGDPIERDPAGEDPRTWHHTNGEKHDHEAEPGEGAKESRRRVMAEGGSTCSVCGDPCTRDPEGEEPRTWHHTNGEKHDHEAKPSGGGEKESHRRTAINDVGTCGSCGKTIYPVRWLGQTFWADRKHAYGENPGGQSIKCPNHDHGHHPDDPEMERKYVRMDMRSSKTAVERTWPCKQCGAIVTSWGHGEDTECDKCGAQYNAFGQRLRDDWRGNSSNYDEDMGDMEGFERQQLANESYGSRRVTASRSLSEIAKEIRMDWRPPNYAAAPYLDAMRDLNSINDMYGADSGKTIVAYFLNNASSWRGETAKRVKAELKAMLKTGSKDKPNGNAESGLPLEPEGEDVERTMWPWEIKKKTEGAQGDFMHGQNCGEPTKNGPCTKTLGHGGGHSAKQASVTAGWEGDLDKDIFSGGIDNVTKGMLQSVLEALSPANRAKFTAMPLEQAVDLGWKLVTKTRASKDAALSRDCTNGNHSSCTATSCSCPHHKRSQKSGACDDGDHGDCKMDGCPCSCHSKSASKTAAAPTHVVVDETDGTTMGQDSTGAFFTKETATAFANQRNSNLKGEPTFKVYKLTTASKQEQFRSRVQANLVHMGETR